MREKKHFVQFECASRFRIFRLYTSVKFEVFMELLLRRNVKRFRGGLVFNAHRLLYNSTLGSRVIKKKKKVEWGRRQGVTSHLFNTVGSGVKGGGTPGATLNPRLQTLP